MNRKINVNGNENIIIEQFNHLGFYNENDIKKILEYISNHSQILDDTEFIKVENTFPKASQGMMGLMIMENEYYISLKYSTIMITALILDIVVTKGFAAAALAVLGIPNASLVEISEHLGEKCIIKETLTLSEKTGNKYLLEKFHGECCNNQFDCRFKEADKCKCKNADVNYIFEELADKGIFKKIGTNFKYQL